MVGSAHKRWTRASYVPVGGKLQKPLICECGNDTFTVYEQKGLRRTGTTRQVGIYAKCSKVNCGKITRIHSGYPR